MNNKMNASTNQTSQTNQKKLIIPPPPHFGPLPNPIIVPPILQNFSVPCEKNS
jgi:hypothetical protein